jgi:hypothetical protein
MAAFAPPIRWRHHHFERGPGLKRSLIDQQKRVSPECYLLVLPVIATSRQAQLWPVRAAHLVLVRLACQWPLQLERYPSAMAAIAAQSQRVRQLEHRSVVMTVIVPSREQLRLECVAPPVSAKMARQVDVQLEC